MNLRSVAHEKFSEEPLMQTQSSRMEAMHRSVEGDISDTSALVAASTVTQVSLRPPHSSGELSRLLVPEHDDIFELVSGLEVANLRAHLILQFELRLSKHVVRTVSLVLVGLRSNTSTDDAYRAASKKRSPLEFQLQQSALW